MVPFSSRFIHPILIYLTVLTTGLALICPYQTLEPPLWQIRRVRSAQNRRPSRTMPSRSPVYVLSATHRDRSPKIKINRDHQSLKRDVLDGISVYLRSASHSKRDLESIDTTQPFVGLLNRLLQSSNVSGEFSAFQKFQSENCLFQQLQGSRYIPHNSH